MTDIDYQPQPSPNGADVPLPTLVEVSPSFSARLPSQRVLDLLAKVEGMDFGALATTMPFRIVAFRALLRDFPDRDPTSLWLHAYDVEVEVQGADPFGNSSTMPGPGSAPTGT